jgi:hypothetical protein
MTTLRLPKVDEIDQMLGDLMKLLESEPEWHDGEVVHSAHTH